MGALFQLLVFSLWKIYDSDRGILIFLWFTQHLYSLYVVSNLTIPFILCLCNDDCTTFTAQVYCTWKSTGEWEVWFVCCVAGPICVYHSMANPLTDCFNFRESVCKCVRQKADIYQSVKQISLNCGQVHLHTFLITLDWYQPLSLCKASTDMSSYLSACAYTNKHTHITHDAPGKQ